MLALAALLALAACSSAGPADSGDSSEQPGSTGSTDPAPAPTLAACGTAPVSTGPAAAITTISLHGPASAARGSTIPVTSTLRASADGPRIIADPAASQLLVLAGGRVVGRAGNHGSPLPIPVPLRNGASRPMQALPGAVRLVGCPAPGQVAGTELPAGHYALVAVLGYTVDALTGADSTAAMIATPTTFTLVSDPLPLVID